MYRFGADAESVRGIEKGTRSGISPQPFRSDSRAASQDSVAHLRLCTRAQPPTCGVVAGIGGRLGFGLGALVFAM